jgi:putative phosphoribosyl transferase
MDGFLNRVDAGRQLAEKLVRWRGRNAVVEGLPRGGVEVAFEVATALDLEFDVLVVRKLGVPYHPEFAMGAVGEDGVRVVDERTVAAAGVSPGELAQVERVERQELTRRVRQFRGERPPVPIDGREVIVVDDGVATGSTARAACQVARARGASRVVLAVPVAAAATVASLREVADEVVCVLSVHDLRAVGQWYGEFDATPDQVVVDCLERARSRQNPPTGHPGAFAPADRDEEATIDIGGALVSGRLTVPHGSSAVVLFAHGSGSSRFSPRNRAVASALHHQGIGTMLFDLLTLDEERDRANVFDIELLAARLRGATDWVLAELGARCRIGYFGASTGAGAALVAASAPGSPVEAVVSRGGRVDLAGVRLGDVRAPTLMIVGGADPVVLRLNHQAMEQMHCHRRLEVVDGATHLFEEPGAMEQVTRLAGAWFARFLTPTPAGEFWRGVVSTPEGG